MNIDNLIGLKREFNLSPYLTLKTQTIAKNYFEARSKEDLVLAYQLAKKDKIPFFLLGGGSNLVILKEKIDGLVVRNRYRNKQVVGESQITTLLRISSGYPTSLLVKETIELGYGGLEYQLGLPGTVGGAIYMNSKWTKPVAYFGDSLVSATVLDIQGNLKMVEQKYFQFDYDYSHLQKTKELLLDAVFKFKKEKVDTLKKKAEKALEYRKKTQPFGVFSSGCFFKNVGTKSAGQLIDEAGLKDFRVGDFYVSPIHANFIINKGHGSHKDLQRLLSIVKERVYKHSGIRLQEEVIVVK